MSNRILEEWRKDRKPESKADEATKEPLTDDELDDIRTGGAWRNSNKMPLLAVVLEKENRNAPSVLYGTIIGAPYHDPSRGIQFIFEGLHCKGWDDWVQGMFKVSILGGNLEVIRNRLIAGLRAIIREESEENEGLAKDPVQIGKITIETWNPPEK